MAVIHCNCGRWINLDTNVDDVLYTDDGYICDYCATDSEWDYWSERQGN